MQTTEIDINIRKSLKEINESGKLTLAQMATIAGISKSQIRHWIYHNGHRVVAQKQAALDRINEALAGGDEAISKIAPRPDVWRKLNLDYPFGHAKVISMPTEVWWALESLRGEQSQGQFIAGLILSPPAGEGQAGDY